MDVNKTLEERGKVYGDFSVHAMIAQCVMHDFRDAYPPGWHKLNAVQRQALTVIADKIARILSGDPNYRDNWHDIQGYAKLVEDRLAEGRIPMPPDPAPSTPPAYAPTGAPWGD